MWGLSRAIDGFPPSLYSSSRYFIDCIDVIDVPVPSSSSLRDSPMIAQSAPLQERLTCTLFLFSDYVVIAKRASGSTGGKALAGLDDLTVLDRAFASSGRLTPSKMRSRSMTFKGAVKIADICVADLGSDGKLPLIFFSLSIRTETDVLTVTGKPRVCNLFAVASQRSEWPVVQSTVTAVHCRSSTGKH
jgi:hypothetical protein